MSDALTRGRVESPTRPRPAGDWTVPPGETLREALGERRLTQRDFARATGFSQKHISQIVNGHARISPEAAIRFERALGISARFWMHRQADYDLDLARGS